jgi:hypothetical protein
MTLQDYLKHQEAILKTLNEILNPDWYVRGLISEIEFRIMAIKKQIEA